jgi:FkbM family methyltransferase
VNRALTVAGLEVRRKPRSLIRSPHELAITADLLAADLAMRTAGRQLTLVQVGAYDGSSNDPVSPILSRFAWRALLIEPQAEPFRAAAARYAANELVDVLNIAISDHNGSQDLYTVQPGSDAPAWSRQVASFDLHHVETERARLAPSVELTIVATPVETWTFEKLFERQHIDHVDVLQIDAEGYDFELLKLFDVRYRLPSIIGYEHGHLSRADKESAARMLADCGYQIAMGFSGAGADTIAYRPPPGP